VSLQDGFECLSGIYAPAPMEGAASSAPKFLKSHVASAMTGESDIGRKHLAHPAIIERHNEPVIIYLAVCSKDRKSVFASKDSAAVVVDAWQKASLWLVAGMYLCRIIFIFFARPTDFLSRR
jgi:hypothetical protein